MVPPRVLRGSFAAVGRNCAECTALPREPKTPTERLSACRSNCSSHSDERSCHRESAPHQGEANVFGELERSDPSSPAGESPCHLGSATKSRKHETRKEFRVFVSLCFRGELHWSRINRYGPRFSSSVRAFEGPNVRKGCKAISGRRASVPDSRQPLLDVTRLHELDEVQRISWEVTSR